MRNLLKFTWKTKDPGSVLYSSERPRQEDREKESFIQKPDMPFTFISTCNTAHLVPTSVGRDRCYQTPLGLNWYTFLGKLAMF